MHGVHASRGGFRKPGFPLESSRYRPAVNLKAPSDYCNSSANRGEVEISGNMRVQVLSLHFSPIFTMQRKGQQNSNPPGESGVSKGKKTIPFTMLAILEHAANEGVKAAQEKGEKASTEETGEKAFTSKFIETINSMRGDGQNDIVWAIEPNEQETGADLQIQWDAVHDGKTRTEMCNLQLKILYADWYTYQGAVGSSLKNKTEQAKKDFYKKQTQLVADEWNKDPGLFFDAWYKSTSEVTQYQAVSLLNYAYGNDTKRKIEATEETITAGYLLIDNRALFVEKEPRVWVIPITKFAQTIRPNSPVLFLEAENFGATFQEILDKELKPTRSLLERLIKQHGGPISDILSWHEADQRALHTWEQEQRAAQDLHNQKWGPTVNRYLAGSRSILAAGGVRVRQTNTASTSSDVAQAQVQEQDVAQAFKLSAINSSTQLPTASEHMVAVQSSLKDKSEQAKKDFVTKQKQDIDNDAWRNYTLQGTANNYQKDNVNWEGTPPCSAIHGFWHPIQFQPLYRASVCMHARTRTWGGTGEARGILEACNWPWVLVKYVAVCNAYDKLESIRENDADAARN
ncbi:hypothetical protein B0H16DRAFT_1454880 [Mycena metata]|uniref:Uncharacterized protein n=1 Tax=Mycena metata TaxID=1033252 RepID=A0AAD7JJ27_9AGAR|nr:hypothetical protein B0H16DRAFT_1454880 [Mycena metata]